jgi:glycosyltransferase involved in cell wall biosynthesis
MKLAIVVPRYGEEVLGGAEASARQLAEILPRPEYDIQVLTTCAEDLLTWRNVYPPGPTQINGAAVQRFPIEHRFRDRRRHQQIHEKLTHGCPVTVDEEYTWIENSAHSPDLYAHIAQSETRYDLLIFVPYLASTSFYGSAIWPQRSVLWPCLHDEPFAYFLQTRLMMESCCGLMFLSEPELALAREKLGVKNPAARVVGLGFDDDWRGDGDRFRQRFGLSGPFILYSGRFDSMKNLLELLSFFIAYKQLRPGPLKLVLRGQGPLPIPPCPDILPVGFERVQDRLDAYAAAMALCQPSLQESFSIVLMESWLAGTPALVNADCDVTRYHVLQSNGGLAYSGFDEFAGALDWLMAHPLERRQMGQLGRAYVLERYNWPIVLDRFRAALRLWKHL